MLLVMQTQPDYVHVDNLAGQESSQKMSLWERWKSLAAVGSTLLRPKDEQGHHCRSHTFSFLEMRRQSLQAPRGYKPENPA